MVRIIADISEKMLLKTIKNLIRRKRRNQMRMKTIINRVELVEPQIHPVRVPRAANPVSRGPAPLATVADKEAVAVTAEVETIPPAVSGHKAVVPVHRLKLKMINTKYQLN